MNDWAAQKAIEFAGESAKQFMALAVAILAIASASRLIADRRRWLRWIVAVSAIAYCGAFAAGALFLLGLTGSLSPYIDPATQTGLIRYKTRTIQTDTGEITFERDPTPITLRAKEYRPSGVVVELATVEAPSIWTPFLAGTMTTQIVTFAVATLLFTFAFVWSLVSTPAANHIDAEVPTPPDSRRRVKHEGGHTGKRRKRRAG